MTLAQHSTAELSTFEPSTQRAEQRIPISHRHRRRRHFVNVGSSERRISTWSGAALVVLGLARGRVSGLTLASLGGGLLWRGLSGNCPLYSALDVDTVRPREDAATPEDYFKRGLHVEHAVTINRPAAELYQFWRQFENLPRFMKHLESVTVLDDKRSHWVARGPAGMRIEWDAEIINEEPDALIAWRSLGGAEVDNAGSVRFVPAPGDRGTEVRVVIDYIPLAGKVGSIIARLFGEEPEIQVKEDLRRFKRIVEAGELPTIEGQPEGTCGD